MSASDPRTVDLEGLFADLTYSLTATKGMLHRAMPHSNHAITDGRVTVQARDALLEALAGLEQQCALFRWSAANAAMYSPGARFEVRLLVHGRSQAAFEYIEGHAIALIEIVARLRKKCEGRDAVLDARQHIKRLVELGKSLDLPRKPRKRK